MTENTPSQAAVRLPEQISQGLQTYIANGKLRLPMLPDVVLKVLNICEASEGDAQKLADVLHRDQTLAGHVLRVANSPLYKPRMPITSLQQAVNRLGMKQLAEIMYTVTLQNQAFKVVGYEQEINTLWRHAISTAFYTKEIARLQGYDVDKAFLWGLLHDVGKPVVLLTLTQLQREMDCPLDTETVVAAMEAFHTQVGGQLAERWALPVMVKECIMHHHDYLAAPTCAEAAMVTCLADCLSYAVMSMEIDDAAVESLSQHPVVSHLRLSPKQMEGLLGKVEEVIQVMASMSTS